jgi:micrococcal nuclease
MYEYRALVRKVYDGDTITVDIDLGFDVILKNQRIRLLGIDTPEIRGEEREKGLISRNALRERIGNKWVTIKTKQDKKGKYGRWLGTIYIEQENINIWLISEGYAVVYGG